MQGSTKPLVKMCGMFRDEDIDAVNEVMPDYCGFVVNFPKSHRSVSPERAEELASRLDLAIEPVAVVVNQPVDMLAALVVGGVITTIQLHGDEDDAYIGALREAAPEARIISAFRVRTEDDVVRACKSDADLILLDSGQGSGAAFDWSLALKSTRPFLLAGGLGPDNLPKALEQVRPYGVDLSSALETEKLKDGAKMRAVMDIVNNENARCASARAE